MMHLEITVPALGESITEVEIGQWLKAEGDTVAKDENLVVIESSKATLELPSPIAGVMGKILKPKGSVVQIGEVIVTLHSNTVASLPEVAPAKIEAPPRKEVPLPIETPAPTSTPAPELGTRAEEVVPMSRLRRTVAQRLVEAQNNAALLTTFNEVDMSAIAQLRKDYQEAFVAKYGVKLGFMSFFIKASVDALKLVPQVNAEIRGSDVIYKNYYDIGVAVGGGKGLVVPIIRNAERMSFSELELKVADLGKRAKENKITLDELAGGTFTISNGGVYGSLLSTPIVNPPQSGILGIHTIQDRPVARDGQVVIRPMMYLALTYDHRIVDGREAVTFLKRIKDILENPTRLLIEV
jgi:2-oxoglutarate dehydrogenase E2 component (dihydrolipoamide succinyltransferase)